MNGLIALIFILIVIGFLLSWFNSYVNIDSSIKQLINGIVVIALLYYVLVFFGLLGGWPHIR